MRCADRWPDRPTPLGSESYLIAYDWVTKEVERIVEAPLPDSSLSRRFSWNPQMTQGVQELSGLYGLLFWLTPEAPEPMTVTVSNGDVNWLMSENFQAHVDHRESSSDTGIARAPTWSSNNEIAFFASLNAVGRDGPDRTHGPWSIYLMHASNHEPVAVLDDVYGPATLDWSPDGNWLAFSAKYGRFNRSALWLFSPSLKQAHLVQEGVFVNVAWAPHGNALMAMECVGEVCESTALWQFELNRLQPTHSP
jgi:hypothetical protein